MTENTTETTAPRIAEQLTRTVGRLTALMQDEVRLLETMRTGEIESLLPDKQAATKTYRDLLGQLADRPELLRDLDSEAKTAIKAAAQDLAAATEANALALRAGIEVNGRLVRAIAHAVRDEQRGGNRYQANGGLSEGGPVDTLPAVSVNQVL